MTDLSGLKIGAVTIIGRDSIIDGKPTWLARCVCGQEFTRRHQAMARGGERASCGCLRPLSQAVANTTHGMTGTRTYASWAAMRQRCFNRNNPKFKSYGGCGISVCARWRDSFAAFLSDMGVRPRGTTIDRIDPFGNYEPENCRWASPKQQAETKRVVTKYTANGRSLMLTQWGDVTGFGMHTMHDRVVRRGWSIDRAINQPKRKPGAAP